MPFPVNKFATAANYFGLSLVFTTILHIITACLDVSAQFQSAQLQIKNAQNRKIHGL